MFNKSQPSKDATATAIQNVYSSGTINYSTIAGLFGVVTIILSVIVGKGIITIATAVSIFLFFSSIIVSGVIAIIIYKRTNGNLSSQIKELKDKSNKNIEELLTGQSTTFIDKAKKDNETNIDIIFRQVSSSNEGVLTTTMTTLGEFINYITSWLTPSSATANSIPMKKSVKINGISYTSLINPTSNSIDHLLLNIIPTNYGIMDSFNDVDDMFARIKVGKELPKENTYSFTETFEFNKAERNKPGEPITVTKTPGGGNPKNTRNKKKSRRSKKSKKLYNKTRKMKRKKYI
jgi:ABC-type multidrug transport system fused ATPase/permease subunit